MAQQGRKRRIHFFEPYYVEADGSAKSIGNDFFEIFHRHVSELDPRRLSVPHRGYEYIGAARDSSAPATQFLHLGKLRHAADWPEVRNSQSGEVSALEDLEGDLLEPAYLTPISGTPYFAALRTAGGPTWSAIAEWLTSVSGRRERDGQSIELRPYVRQDALKRLAASMQASKLELRVDPGVDNLESVPGQIAKSVASLQDMGPGALSVAVEISFGRFAPTEETAQQLAKDLNKIVSRVPLRRGKATILERDEETGRLTKERIDFLKDQVTHTEHVGTSVDEIPTASDILHAMGSATQKFRETLAETQGN